MGVDDSVYISQGPLLLYEFVHIGSMAYKPNARTRLKLTSCSLYHSRQFLLSLLFIVMWCQLRCTENWKQEEKVCLASNENKWDDSGFSFPPRNMGGFQFSYYLHICFQNGKLPPNGFFAGRSKLVFKVFCLQYLQFLLLF